jgi:uncharacterized protein (TIGR03118 family)
MEFSMKGNISKNTITIATPKILRGSLFVLVLLLALVCISSFAKDHKNRANRYQQVNLVADLPGVALLQDTNLVNAWGMSFSGSSPFWISDNGSGLATLYAVTNDNSGTVHVTKQGLEVSIPGEGNPTGQLFDGSGGFNGDIFIFASEDGTISGWRPALGTTAETLATRSAVYKGITLVTNTDTPMLLAANFSEGTIDAYVSGGSGATLSAQYSDKNAPAGYAPFNVQSLDGMVFVTFAKQDADKEDDVAGPGNGFIDIFNPKTGNFRRFATGSDAGGNLDQIDSPWGLAIAPGSFGRHGDQLLVGNFGSGTIMSFDDNGRFQGLLKSADGGPVVIDGLWALAFGNGGRAGTPDTLFFTAGPDDESHGLFGSLTPVSRRHNDEGNDEDDDE